jgi:MSHA biogenesis protein MshO
MKAIRQRGFTLMELVVAIAISSIVVVFVGMFLTAPLGAFEAQSRRNAMVGNITAAWPRLHDDLREALPNSVRTRVNGNYVVIEMLKVVGMTRYTTAPAAGSFDAAGTVAGVFKGQQASQLTPIRLYLSVNPGANVYTAGNRLVLTDLTWNTRTAAPNIGSASVTMNPLPAFAFDSPRNRAYLVSGPVTYLCDLTAAQRTLRRYEGYALAANQASRDAPNEFTTGTNTLIARGITGCNFQASPQNQTVRAQTVAVRLTSVRNNENMTLLHEARPEYVP